MKHIKILMVLVGFFGWGLAYANLSIRFDLESKIKEKVSSVLQSYDARAQVMVSVELKKLDVVLPGAGDEAVVLDSTATSTNISVQDIEKVKIKVRSEKNLFPETIGETVSINLGIPRNKIVIEFEAFTSQNSSGAKDAQMSPLQNISEQSSKFLSVFTSVEQSLGRFFYVSLGVLVVLLGLLVFNILGVFVFKRSSSDQVKAIQSLGEEIKNRSEKGAESIQTQNIHTTEGSQRGSFERAPSPIRSSKDQRQDDRSIQSLSIASLISLISDCYWSKKDAYAAYLWANMSREQKDGILLDWKTAESYSEFLVEVSPEFQNYHEHPYYFKAQPFIHTSNEDLVKLIKADQTVWNLCSPIRKKEFLLSVIELIQLNSQDKTVQTKQKFNIISKKRELSANFNFDQVTESDELAIFENPDLIPVSMRPEIKSLVWFALLPLEARQSLLHEWSANQLSEIWVGPEIFIHKLKEAISEKKLPLVQEYQSKIVKNRRHPLMDQLTKNALLRLDQENEITKKAA